MYKLISDWQVKNIQEKTAIEGYKVSRKAIEQVYTCRVNGNYTPMFATNLYNKQSCAYVTLLMVMSWVLGK